MKLKHPSQKTLSKYGLTHDEWAEIAARQLGVCGVCGILPKSGRLNIDHEHAKGWKKMPANQRKRFVRGLLCYMCNLFYMARGMNTDKAYGIVRYIERYEKESQT